MGWVLYGVAVVDSAQTAFGSVATGGAEQR